MLTSFTVSDFKSYDRATLKLAPLTVLVGANASGKSNVIEALRLLSWMVQGNRLGAIRYAVYEGDGAVRGTTDTLARRGVRRFSLGADVEDSVSWHYMVSIGLSMDSELHIVDERVSRDDSKVPLYEIVKAQDGAGNDLRVAYDNFSRGGRKPQITCSDQVAVLLQMQTAAVFENSHKAAQIQIPRVCAAIQSDLANTLFLDPQPSLMRTYSFKSEHRLSGNGANLSGVLYNICQQSAGEAKVLDLIRSLPEQNVQAIDFIETPRGEVMLQLRETFGGRTMDFDATLLSDGTLRALSIAAAAHTAPSGSLVVIEEIDNGVHPSRAEMLLKNLSSIARQRDLRILISSHNPALLDALPADAIPHVVFCYRDDQSGASRLIQLQDVDDYPELVSQGPLGQLMTKGLIEAFVKNHPGPDARRRRAQAWLDNLRSISAH